VVSSAVVEVAVAEVLAVFVDRTDDIDERRVERAAFFVAILVVLLRALDTRPPSAETLALSAIEKRTARITAPKFILAICRPIPATIDTPAVRLLEHMRQSPRQPSDIRDLIGSFCKIESTNQIRSFA
jgi:hypothetical protein